MSRISASTLDGTPEYRREIQGTSLVKKSTSSDGLMNFE